MHCMDDAILRLVMARQNDVDAEGLRRDVLERALRYVGFRFSWELYSREEKMDRDTARASAHDAFMDSVNIYVRYLNRINGTQNEGLGSDRKANGDLACRIVYEVAFRHR